MDRDALGRLIEAVERGEDCPGPRYGWWEGTINTQAWGLICIIMEDSSLDAAKALMEAVLPGWVVRITAGGTSSFPHVHVFKMRQTEEDPVRSGNSSGFKGYEPARAWLLAILRALQSQTD